MNTKNKLGVWLDHSIAVLIDLNANNQLHTIASDFTNEIKEEALDRSETLMQNKRQQMHKAFYAKIGHELLKFKHVLLFGPTNAKTELRNFLNEDLHYKDLKMDVEAADYMSENEKIAFVKKHFQ